MDRCRCDDYKAAIEKLKFFTVGTHRPDIIEKHQRGDYFTRWVRNGIDYEDLKFLKPKAYKRLKPHELPENMMSKRSYQIEKMWCPFMTPVRK
ncbi:unnamed protein product [Chrysodeixis includens]|uniref:Uncharacterized protein n=1 Tax=Chrysodeixis includens TaxID=689277 RepID=A0A9P0FTK5_CHRIL|nr:unnamed protein product [Chrysodeixis includens]